MYVCMFFTIMAAIKVVATTVNSNKGEFLQKEKKLKKKSNQIHISFNTLLAPPSLNPSIPLRKKFRNF